jgi:hypothetical protein
MKGRDRPRILFISSLLLTLGTTGCSYDVIIDPGRDEDDGLREQFPQLDDWRVSIDTALAEDVGLINIGGRAFEHNFANRGDVEVRFDGEDGRIKVELRKFTFAPSVEDARSAFDALSVWAFAGESLRAPDASMAASACAELWADACELRVYYDGQVQPLRTGADIRVTLPPSFDGHLSVHTEDVTVDDEYPLQGDVRIIGLPGSADVEVERGVVEISLAREILPAPACGFEANQSCEAWTEDGTPAPWALGCGCTDFGRVKVEAESADVTVEVPVDLWAQLSLENAYESNTELGCEVEVECGSFEQCEMLFVDELVPGRLRAELNDPGERALEGAGYLVNVLSDACVSASYVDGPEDYQDPKVARRGDLRVCSDCLD